MLGLEHSYNGPVSAQKRGRWPRPNYHPMNTKKLGSQIASKVGHFEMVVELEKLGSDFDPQFVYKVVMHLKEDLQHLLENILRISRQVERRY